MHDGERLKLLRIRRGLGQKQAADAIGVARQTISNIENGSETTKSTMLALLKLYEVTWSEFEERKEKLRHYEPHSDIHEKLQSVMDGPEEVKQWVGIAIELAYEHGLKNRSEHAKVGANLHLKGIRREN